MFILSHISIFHLLTEYFRFSLSIVDVDKKYDVSK